MDHRRSSCKVLDEAYRGRNVIERAFNGFKHWRGLATRYDKHATVYRGAVVLAAALLWINDLSVLSPAEDQVRTIGFVLIWVTKVRRKEIRADGPRAARSPSRTQ